MAIVIIYLYLMMELNRHHFITKLHNMTVSTGALKVCIGASTVLLAIQIIITYTVFNDEA